MPKIYKRGFKEKITYENMYNAYLQANNSNVSNKVQTGNISVNSNITVIPQDSNNVKVENGIEEIQKEDEDNTVNESNNTDIIEQQENIIEEGKTPNVKTIVVITTTLISISIICYIVYHKLK